MSKKNNGITNKSSKRRNGRGMDYYDYATRYGRSMYMCETSIKAILECYKEYIRSERHM